MNAPPEPPESQPLERFLWVRKAQIVDWMQDFRNGAFREKITWSTDLLEAYKILLSSQLLNHQEKALVVRKGNGVNNIMQDLAAGKTVTLEDMFDRTGDVTLAFFHIVDNERKPRGQDILSTMVKQLNSDKVGGFNTDGTVTMTKEDKVVEYANTTDMVEEMLEGERKQYVERQKQKAQAEGDGADGAKNAQTGDTADQDAENLNVEKLAQQELGATKADADKAKVKTKTAYAQPTVESDNEDDGPGEAFKKNIRGAFL